MRFDLQSTMGRCTWPSTMVAQPANAIRGEPRPWSAVRRMARA